MALRINVLCHACLDMNRHSCEKTWTHTLSALDLTTGWQTNKGGFEIFKFPIG